MTSLIKFLSEDFQRADLIALAALLVGCLAAIYARRQAVEAKLSRLGSVRESRRPQRLEVLRLARDFCRFCGTYYTMYCMGTVNGTRDLVAEIAAFKLDIELHGPLEMPQVEAELSALQTMAWGLQRHLDRMGFQNSVRRDGPCSEADEDAVHALTDQFADKRAGLHGLFAPFLSEG